MITGGLGDVGLILARHLASQMLAFNGSIEAREVAVVSGGRGLRKVRQQGSGIRSQGSEIGSAAGNATAG